MQSDPVPSQHSSQTRLGRKGATEPSEPERLLEQDDSKGAQLRKDLRAAQAEVVAYDTDAGLRRLQRALQNDEA